MSSHVKKTIKTTTIAQSPEGTPHTFAKKLRRLCLTEFLNVTLFNNFSKLEKGLRRSFPTLVLEILYSSYLLILLIYTIYKNNKMKS